MKIWQKTLVSINLFLGFLFLKTRLVLAQTTSPDDYLDNTLFFKPNIGTYVSLFVQIAMIIGALVCLAMIILGGIAWISSSGDKGKLEEARKRITSAIIGLAILASVWVLWELVLQFLGINSLFGKEV